jgi:hypothetical protein
MLISIIISFLVVTSLCNRVDCNIKWYNNVDNNIIQTKPINQMENQETMSDRNKYHDNKEANIENPNFIVYRK